MPGIDPQQQTVRLSASELADLAQHREPGRAVERLAFAASDAASAQDALSDLTDRYGNADPEDADVIVVLGGDGFMLQALHKYLHTGTPMYGMNRGASAS